MKYKRKKNDKFGFSRLKTCPLKGTAKKMKRQDTEQNICNNYLTKDLCSENINKFTTKL